MKQIDPVGQDTATCSHCGCDLFTQKDIATYKKHGATNIGSREAANKDTIFYVKECFNCGFVSLPKTIGIQNSRTTDYINKAKERIASLAGPFKLLKDKESSKDVSESTDKSKEFESLYNQMQELSSKVDQAIDVLTDTINKQAEAIEIAIEMSKPEEKKPRKKKDKADNEPAS